MNPGRIGALTLHEVKITAKDPAPLVIFVAMPLIVMGLVTPMFGLALHAEGYTAASGAEHAVPSQALMFGMFLVVLGGFSFYRDHQWFTWERLRTTQATSAELLIGKCAPIYLLSVVQLGFLFAAAIPLFGLRLSPGTVLPLIATVLVSAAMITSLSVALAALCRSVQQFSSLGNLLALACSGLGGALVPASLLPSWAEHIAPASPVYWSIKAFQSTFLDRVSWSGVWLPVLILSGFALSLAALATWRFDSAEAKVAWE